MNQQQATQAYSNYQTVTSMVEELNGRDNLSFSAKTFILNADKAESTFDYEFLANMSKKF